VKRLLSSSLVALVAFSVHAAYGVPTRSTQILRAVRCCSTHCDHAKSQSPAAAGHCCGVAGAGSELAVTSQTKLPERGPAMHFVPAEFDAFLALDGDESGWARALPARARSAPLFLLTHSLRN
jgi:hypothetical protein